MKLKALLNLLPIVVVSITGITLWQQYQQQQALARPDYDNPTLADNPGRSPQPGFSQTWQVVRIADGDTLTVRSGNRQEKLRLCGIDAPEVTHGNKPGQPFGNEATAKLRSLLQSAGNRVIVVPVERDRYGRQVAEVFIAAPTSQQPGQEKLVNYEMVVAGLAYHYARYSDSCPNGQLLPQAEAIAKQQRRGVWSRPDSIRPWDFRRQ